MFSRRLFREIFREFQEFFGEVSQAVLILSISVDTFFTRISIPKQHPEIYNISVV